MVYIYILYYIYNIIIWYIYDIYIYIYDIYIYMYDIYIYHIYDIYIYDIYIYIYIILIYICIYIYMFEVAFPKQSLACLVVLRACFAWCWESDDANPADLSPDGYGASRLPEGRPA